MEKSISNYINSLFENYEDFYIPSPHRGYNLDEMDNDFFKSLSKIIEFRESGNLSSQTSRRLITHLMADYIRNLVIERL
ncbi:hypothetical protein AMJ80_05365 [bacterium SM23_31]|nr:MAG: hypothetical protein AMJ80_05365 [bacterium SM23_31]